MSEPTYAELKEQMTELVAAMTEFLVLLDKRLNEKERSAEDFRYQDSVSRLYAALARAGAC